MKRRMESDCGQKTAWGRIAVFHSEDSWEPQVGLTGKKTQRKADSQEVVLPNQIG